jgi:hypothetical protein
MAAKCYNYERESDRANNLQRMTDLLFQKNVICENVDRASSCNISENNLKVNLNKREQNEAELQINVDQNNEILCSDVSQQTNEKFSQKQYDDWGKLHPEYSNMGDKISWTRFEKEYIKECCKEYSPQTRNKWRLCLDSILNADVNVRQNFHIKHLNTVKIKDSMRS